jgi:osmotically inducible protein OsmC
MAFSATAQWTGDKSGAGKFSLGSGAVKDVTYTFGDRFEDKGGSTPEELIAAAHIGCFIMYLTAVLPDNKHEGITGEAKVSLGKDDTGPVITDIRLKVTAKVPGLGQAAFDELIAKTKANCPISRVLKGNAEIKVDATLQS